MKRNSDQRWPQIAGMVFLAVIGIASLLVTVWDFFDGERGWWGREKTEKSEKSSSNNSKKLLIEQIRSSSAAARPSDELSQIESDRKIVWNEFKKKFGDKLEPVYLNDGFLASVKGGLSNRVIVDGYVSNEVNAKMRASEIVDRARFLLGIDPSSPLGEPVIRSDQYTSQVSFPQTVNGTRLFPYGDVTVNLGPKGELLALYSTYVRNLEIQNQVELTLSDAQARVKEELIDFGSAAVRGGEPVIWVPWPTSRGDKTVARNAYEFEAKGEVILVDSESGEIVYRRDHRKY